MDVRSLRMSLGWSREELARRSGVSFASVYLNERTGTAGPEDDARMVRTLLASHRTRSPKLLLGNDWVVWGPANDNGAQHPGEPLAAATVCPGARAAALSLPHRRDVGRVGRP